MARYDSASTETDGQYPTTAFHLFGLPEQNFTSGAPGSSQPSKEEDQGGSSQPGQYPAKEDFTGVTLDGSGAPGGPSVGPSGSGGSDTVTYSLTTFYKGEDTPGANEQGNVTATSSGDISGDSDWTAANRYGYNAPAQFQMPGTAGNTPTPGSGRYQTDGQDGSNHVMYGGWLKGSRAVHSAVTRAAAAREPEQEVRVEDLTRDPKTGGRAYLVPSSMSAGGEVHFDPKNIQMTAEGSQPVSAPSPQFPGQAPETLPLPVDSITNPDPIPVSYPGDQEKPAVSGPVNDGNGRFGVTPAGAVWKKL